MRNVMRSVTVNPELVIHSVKIHTHEGTLLWAIRAASYLPSHEFRHEQRGMTLYMEDGKLWIRNMCGIVASFMEKYSYWLFGQQGL